MSERKKLLTEIKLEYTGGGIYSYSAKFNDEVWLYGDLDTGFGSCDAPYDVVSNDWTERGIPYDSHWKSPSVPYPTWRDILDSIKDTPKCRHLYDDAVKAIETFQSTRMDNMIINDDKWKDNQIPKHDYSLPISGSSEQLNVLAEIIEVFEDFLDEKCIDIDNDEKDDAIDDGEDPESISNIYGCDYGDLEDALRPILVRLGVFTSEDN